ncbi:hypothetical protein C8R46DRAFT_1345427 [Mycena filopes]|nr:hypothetical protein C8R46DRAFT_1345427 [Mycena filopes]
MSQLSNGSIGSLYSSVQCRWKWCSNTFPTIRELLEHVREHVRETEPCSIRDIPLNIRAEEGFGESMSGMGFGSYTQSQNHNADPAPNSPAPRLLPGGISLPAINLARLSNTPERAAKRRKIMSPATNVPSFTLPQLTPPSMTPPPRGMNVTPSFATLALPPDSVKSIPNPKFPDFNALMAEALAPSVRDAFDTPNKPLSHENPGSQDFSGSDRSVERQLTQDIDGSFVVTSTDAIMSNGIGGSQNLYAGELQWDDERSQGLRRSPSPTPDNSFESQSQSQPQSASVDTSPRLPQRRQSWYQSPRRVSNPKKAPPGGQRTPLASRFAPPDAPDTLSPPAKMTTPRNVFLSGSLKIQSPSGGHSQPYGDTVDPSVLSQPQYSQASLVCSSNAGAI